jgi:hypothetical protein
MKRAIVAILLLVPGTLAAQDRQLTFPTAGTEAGVGVQVQAPQPTPPPSDPRGRRRPSMVGYIEDAIVASRVRVRFDAGLHARVPDRAEFFYGKCGCFRDLTIPAIFDPEAAGPGPGLLTDLNFQQMHFEAEYALSDRFSVFGALPFRWIQPQEFVPDVEGRFATFGNHGGLGDVRLGLKVGLAASEDQALTAQFQVFTPSAESLDGLGTGHWSVEPALLYYRRLSDRFALESEFGAWLPTGGSPGIPTAGDEKFSGEVLFYGVGPSVTLYRDDRFEFTPVLEFVAWHVLGGFQTTPPNVEADGVDIVNLKIGARFGFGDRSSIYIGYGHALTDADWYDDIVRTEYRYSF